MFSAATPDQPPTQPDPVRAAEPTSDQEETQGNGATARATAVLEGLDLEKVTGLWPAVIDQVREGGSELLSHVLAAARPVAVNIEEAVLEIGFPPSAAFNKRKAEGNEARDRFADAVKNIVGERLRPVYVLLEGDEIETPPEAKLSEDELIELVRSEFDAEEYVVEQPDEAEAKEM